MPVGEPDDSLTAVVTGASSGIGEAIARALAARGWGVTLVARRADRLATLAAELGAAGVRAVPLPCDLADRADRTSLVEQVAEQGLSVGILVNNAGLSTSGPIWRAHPERELEMLEVDVAAVVDLTCRFVPQMVARGAGGILNVASTGAFQPLPGQAGYGAAKAFVLSWSRSLDAELAGHGVRVTALCPGPVDTGFGERAGLSSAEAHRALPAVLWRSPEQVAQAGVDGLWAGRPLVIPGWPNQVAAAAVGLLPKRPLARAIASRHPALRDRFD